MASVLYGDTSGWMNGFQWVINNKYEELNWSGRSYIDSTDKDEDDDNKINYKTVVSYRPPLRETKCVFVTEMPDFYTDNELNTAYHTKQEYVESVAKYGYIYKSQKFQNADTPQKLLQYATDWIKNNYHGGLTSFTITALDMYIMGETDLNKYTVGKRVRVRYIDPSTHQKMERVLTIISIDYDLQNPDKNSYKIGIPDSTLNKTYGETSKKGGGGGGGGNTSTDNDTDDEVDIEGLTDDLDGTSRELSETAWAHVGQMVNAGASESEIGEYLASNLLTPGEKDPGSDYTYVLTSDLLKSGDVLATIIEAKTKLKSKYIVSEGAVEAKKVESNEGNITSIASEFLSNSDTIETKDLTASNDVKATNNVEATEVVKGKKGEFTNGIKTGSYNVSFSVSNGKPVITINGTRYVLVVDD